MDWKILLRFFWGSFGHHFAQTSQSHFPEVKGEINYTFLLKEADAGVRWISVLTNIADQLYYPCEHIAWAADADLIKVKSDKWWLLCTVLWGTSLLLGILRCDISFN